MPDTLRLNDGSYMRRPDVQSIIQFLFAMHCVEVIGFSNIGKSALLRLLAQPDVWIQELGEAGRDFLPIYVDCNRMVEMSDHGFYELMLRCLQESSEQLAQLPDLLKAYEIIAAPSSEFQVPLSFTRGMTAALRADKTKLVFLLDEFDEPFAHLASRVFINLRALKDRHGDRIAYVTATEQVLTNRRTEDHCGDFCELFSHHMWYLAPLTRSDVERFIRRYMTDFDVAFTAADIDFIYTWAGGHPRFLEGVCRVLEKALEGADNVQTDITDRWPLHQDAIRALRNDEELTLECDKIWEKCSPAERDELLALFKADYQPNTMVVSALARQYVLLKVEGKYQLFCTLLTDYLQRKRAPMRPASAHLWVDIQRGEVIVAGKPVEALTNLEYRLISLLFQNHDKIIDKYEIVTNVWGEGYIDEVDDARIEKLVSRVRQKIEVDPSSPKFLTTVRGRGYKLILE
jgi:hypothetical protein